MKDEFHVLTLSRGDMEAILREKWQLSREDAALIMDRIATDGEMEWIARKMGDAMMDIFWDALENGMDRFKESWWRELEGKDRRMKR